MIPCTLRQLEIFIAAAEDCHFSRTAHRLGISQPAISSHIAALENQFGQQLFIRRAGTRPMLSEHGIQLLREARAFLAEGDKIRRFRGRPAQKQRAVVRVCAGVHLLDDCIKPRLPEFHARHPNVALECEHVRTPTQGAQLVKSGKADMLLYTVAEPADYSLHFDVLRPVRFGLYGSPEFASRRGAPPEELALMPFVLPFEGSEADRMVQAALLKTGILCANIAARAQFSDVILGMARQGRGIAALFETMLMPGDTEQLIKFDVELPTMHRTLFRMNRPPSRAAQAVEGFLREVLV